MWTRVVVRYGDVRIAIDSGFRSRRVKESGMAQMPNGLRRSVGTVGVKDKPHLYNFSHLSSLVVASIYDSFGPLLLRKATNKYIK